MARRIQRVGTTTHARATTGAAVLEAAAAYERSMSLIRARLLAIEQSSQPDARVQIEQLALHIRKIIEGVAFAALSAVEHRNGQVLREQRTKDADKILRWLDAKGLLRLPNAQRIEASPDPQYRAAFAGSGEHDVALSDLMSAYSRASAVIHERHPERLSMEQLERELSALQEDARRLRSWLWLHIMFLRGEGFLIQMGQYGTPSFFIPLSKEGDLPTEFEQGLTPTGSESTQ